MLWLLGGGTRSFPHVGANELSSFLRCQRDRLEKFAITVETWHVHSRPGGPLLHTFSPLKGKISKQSTVNKVQ